MAGQWRYVRTVAVQSHVHMTADTLGVDEVVRHIEVVPDDRDERVVCFLVRSMGTTVHHLQSICLADVVSHFGRVMAHNQQLIAVTDFLQTFLIVDIMKTSLVLNDEGTCMREAIQVPVKIMASCDIA